MITGKRVRLRAISREDLPLFVQWLNDPEVTEGLSHYYPLSMPQEEKWFEQVLQAPPAEQPLTIELLEDDAWVAAGNCGFFAVNWRVRSAEFGIFIGNKSFWNRGYGTEAVRLCLAYGFGTLNFNRIFLRVFATNERAARVYEKAGFVREGRLRQAHYHQGNYVDVLMMGILRDEWMHTKA